MRILIVEDHQATREEMRTLIELQPRTCTSWRRRRPARTPLSGVSVDQPL